LRTFVLYGVQVTKRYKTFLATYRPAGGLIRVVLVQEDDGSWRAYFCTHADATVEEILGERPPTPVLDGHGLISAKEVAMSTINQRRSDKERFWRRMIRHWRSSGLSVRAFCAE